MIFRAKEGDTVAFRLLVEKHKDVSLSLAYSILKNKALAEDVLQDVFIKIYEKLNTFKFKSAFSTWLYRIVINTSYNELRKRKSTSPLQNETEDFLFIPAEDKDHLKEEDQKRYINLALKHLKTDEALVLRLFYLCELSIREIQTITKFKPSKIKTDLHRGRINLNFQLRMLLKDDISYLL